MTGIFHHSGRYGSDNNYRVLTKDESTVTVLEITNDELPVGRPFTRRLEKTPLSTYIRVMPDMVAVLEITD